MGAILGLIIGLFVVGTFASVLYLILKFYNDIDEPIISFKKKNKRPQSHDPAF